MKKTISSRSTRTARYPLYVVPHSHFDLIWRRPVGWYRQRRAVIYSAALDLLEARPEFRYSFSQAMGLQLFFRDFPGEKRRFQRFLKEGRLEIIGGPLTIPDLNLAHGESIVRNQLGGLDWLQQTLGLRPTLACMEDAFGAPASLPALLRSCGMTFCRGSRMPRPGKKDLNGPLLWPSHDGTLLPTGGPEGMAWGFGQSSNIDAPPNDAAGMVEQYRLDLQACPWDGSRPVLFSFAGEEHVPTGENVEAFVVAIRSLKIPFVWATAAEFVDALQTSGAMKSAPRVCDDVSRLFTGCYSSRIRQKLAIADLESSLLAAENMSARGLEKSWHDLFLMQFHDAYGGCHTPENAVFMERVLTRARARVNRTLTGPQLGNPLLFERHLPFLVPTGLRRGGKKAVVAQDFDGELMANVPLAALSSVSVTVQGRDGIGASARRAVRRRAQPDRTAADSVPPGLLRLREDVGTLWTEDYTGREWHEPADFAKLERVEDGPVFSRSVWTGFLRFGPELWPGFTSLSWRRSLLTFKDSPVQWLRMEFEWWGNSTEISWSFKPFGRRVPAVTASMPFGSVARGVYAPGRDGLTGDVFPSPQWVAASDDNSAWLVLHRGQPAFRAVAGGLENILLRSPVKRWMPFFPVSPDVTSWENGKHAADFLLVPQAKVDPAEAMRLGLAFQTGVRATRAVSGPEWIATLPDNCVATSLARVGAAWRVRLCETRGAAAVWSAPEGYSAELRSFAGAITVPAAPTVQIPPRWMGDLWVTQGHPPARRGKISV